MRVGVESQVQLYDIQSILVTRLRFMGDVILTTPVIRALKQKFPTAHIAFLAETPYIELLANNPHLNELIVLDRKGYNKQGVISRLSEYTKFSISFYTKRFDLAIDLLGNPRSAWLSWLSGARFRVGGYFRGRRYLYTVRVQDDGKIKTAVEFHLQYLAAIGVPSDGFETEIFTTKQEDDWARVHLQQMGVDKKKRVIGIHVGATWPAKQWLPGRFAKLCDRLVSEYAAQIVFTVGPGEENLVQQVRSDISKKTYSAGILSLRQLAALLKQFDLFVSNDCGPMHLAPAVGTKTIGIFGPGEPEIWFPYDKAQGHRVVHKEIDCSRCHRDVCEKMDCMRVIQVEDVMQAVEDSI